MTSPLATAAFLSQAAALALAHPHVTYLNAHIPPPGSQRWVVSKPVEYALYWYFDYQTDLDPTQPLDLTNLFAYAPGYLIWKQTHACSLIGWAEYPTLSQREDLYQQAQRRTAWLLAEPVSLARLRAHLRLRLPQLVPLRHTLRTLAERPAQGAYLIPLFTRPGLKGSAAVPPAFHSSYSVSLVHPPRKVSAVLASTSAVACTRCRSNTY